LRTAIKTMAVLSTVVLAVVLSPGGASAAPLDDKAPVTPDGSQSIDEAIQQPVPGRFASWRAFYETQDRLDAIGTQIVLASANGTGYAGIAVDVEQNAVDLYWQGDLPAEVRQIVAGAPVRVHPAAYTEVDLVAQAQRAAQLPGVTQTGPKVDGSGLLVKVSSTAPRSTLDALRGIVSVPYDLSVKEPARLGAFNKVNDMPSFWGGARIIWQPTGAMCSTAFAVKPAGEPAKMLTAGHCRPWGSSFDNFTDGGGDVMGTASHQAHFRDTVLIDTKVAGRIYIGNFDSNVSRPVKDAFLSFVGDSVCRSSSFSNQMCGLKVVATNQSVSACSSEGCWSASPMVEAEQVNDLSAGGNGDSGGAVFSFRNDGGVNARGSFSASDDGEVACTGVPTQAGRSCTTGMFYADIVFTIIFYKATLVTG
jgi:hypothetical protein